MSDQYDSSAAEYKQRWEHAFHSNELRGDFIEWLFDTELDHLDYSETWQKFIELRSKEDLSQQTAPATE